MAFPSILRILPTERAIKINRTKSSAVRPSHVVKALRPPDKATLTSTYERIKELHAKAYGWNPPEIEVLSGQISRRMRSYVRRWVNEWDLRRLYPDSPVCTEEGPEEQPTYELDLMLEQGAETSLD